MYAVPCVDLSSHDSRLKEQDKCFAEYLSDRILMREVALVLPQYLASV